MILAAYKRFFCGLCDLMNRFNPGGGEVKALGLTTILLMLLIFATERLLTLLFHTSSLFKNSYQLLATVLVAGVANYFLVFHKKRYMKYYRTRMPEVFVVAIVVIIFAGSLALILTAGPRSAR